MRPWIFSLASLAILVILACLGVRADSAAFVGSLFAAFLSVLVVFFVEIMRRPQINIVEEEKPPDLPRKFLRVIVKNRGLKSPLNLIMDRRPAYQVRAYVKFLTDKNEPKFEGREMIGRWSNTPEPSLSILVSEGPDPITKGLWDSRLTRDAVDISSGGSEPLDIVMREPLEEGCRGWHNRIIENPYPKPEDKFELPKGKYRALVRVEVSGRRFEALFWIVCDQDIKNFLLEPLNRDFILSIPAPPVIRVGEISY